MIFKFSFHPKLIIFRKLWVVFNIWLRHFLAYSHKASGRYPSRCLHWLRLGRSLPVWGLGGSVHKPMDFGHFRFGQIAPLPHGKIQMHVHDPYAL